MGLAQTSTKFKNTVPYFARWVVDHARVRDLSDSADEHDEVFALLQVAHGLVVWDLEETQVVHLQDLISHLYTNKQARLINIDELASFR